jgi:MFS family permease
MAEPMDRKSSIVGLIGIFSLFAVGTLFTGLTPAINTLAGHFSTTPFETIMLANTITGLVMVPFSIIGGAMASRVGYKALSLIGILIAIIGGAYPFLLAGTDNYLWVILSRAVTGVGVGLVLPLGGAIVMAMFSGQKRVFYLGMGNLVFNLASIVYQTLGGVLALYGWNYVFLFYLAGFIPFVLVLFFLPKIDTQNPANENADAAEDVIGGIDDYDEATSTGRGLPMAVWGYIALILIITTFDIATPYMTSTMLAERAIGDSAVAGMVTNVWAVVGCAAGLVFAAVLKVLRKLIYSVLCLVGAAGFMVMFVAQDTLLYSVAVLLVALAHFALFVGFQNAAAAAAPKAKAGMVNGLVMASMSVASFLGGYAIAIAQSALPTLGTAAPFVTGTVCLSALAVVLFFAIFIVGRKARSAS